MQETQIDFVKEFMRAAAVPPVGDSDLVDALTSFWRIVEEVLTGDRTDQAIFDLHYGRRLSFPDLARELHISESIASRRWWAMVSRVIDTVKERARVDKKLDVLSWLVDNPDAFSFVLGTFLPERRELRSGEAELKILKRATMTFGTHGDAVRWLLDDCSALNGRPIDMVVSANGLRDVENVLGCIDHGIIY